jgi:hypothetical protein
MTRAFDTRVREMAELDNALRGKAPVKRRFFDETPLT